MKDVARCILVASKRGSGYVVKISLIITPMMGLIFCCLTPIQLRRPVQLGQLPLFTSRLKSWKFPGGNKSSSPGRTKKLTLGNSLKDEIEKNGCYLNRSPFTMSIDFFALFRTAHPCMPSGIHRNQEQTPSYRLKRIMRSGDG